MTLRAHPAEAFRSAQRRLASSVAVITSGAGREAVGMTATAVTSVSMDPPSLLVCVNRSATLHAEVVRTGRFRVTYLRSDQLDVARSFGGGRPQAERFATASWAMEGEGGPGLDEALAACVCALEQAVDFGTHTVFIGRVESVADGEGAPLLYCNGAYAAGH
jgi:flavin reductase